MLKASARCQIKGRSLELYKSMRIRRRRRRQRSGRRDNYFKGVAIEKIEISALTIEALTSQKSQSISTVRQDVSRSQFRKFHYNFITPSLHVRK